MNIFESNKTDSLEGALTPEGVEFILYPAGPVIRAFAYGIDMLVQALIILIIAITATVIQDLIGIWLYLIMAFLIDWFYHVICELSFKGQSLGKKIMGIRVVRADGSPVDPASSFLRNLLRFADTFFFLYHIVFISMLASSGFRRLGDWAGNTLVVYTRKSLAPIRRLGPLWLTEIEPVSPARPLSYDEKQAVLNFARRYPLLGESRANEIAAAYAKTLREDSAGETQESGKETVSDAGYLLGIAAKLAGSSIAANTGARRRAGDSRGNKTPETAANGKQA